MQLRPYQTEALSAITAKWRDFRRLLLVLPTGCGKTIVFSRLAADAAENGRRTLVLAHREELLDQAADKLMKSTGLTCGMEKAEYTVAGALWSPSVVVGSVQTLTREKRLAKFPANYFDYIVVDEAHHALSDSYQRVLNHFDKAKVLGVTATPDRGDKRNLGEYFEEIAYEYSLHDAIEAGWLAPISAETIPLDIDLAGVKVTAGDYNAGHLGAALEPYLEAIADEMAVRVPERKTLVFLPLVATSERMSELLAQRGFRSSHIDGNSPDRGEILAAFHRGEIDVLCNSMLLTEGFDEPAVDCIVCLRPTKVRALYAQIVGRGTRIAPGKRDCLVLDFLWHTANHDLIHPAHLVAKTGAVADAMTAKIAEAGGLVDLDEVERQVNTEARQQRENALARQLAAQRQKSRRLLNPLEFALSINCADLEDYEPVMGWEMQPATEKQLAALERFGFAQNDIPNKGFASKLLDRVITRRELKLATPKQVNLLAGKGYLNASTMTFEEAKKEIDQLSANGWRVPSVSALRGQWNF